MFHIPLRKECIPHKKTVDKQHRGLPRTSFLEEIEKRYPLVNTHYDFDNVGGKYFLQQTKYRENVSGHISDANSQNLSYEPIDELLIGP